MFTLRLIFAGLVAFVPNNMQPPNELTVLMLNAISPNAIHQGTPPLVHHPAVEFSCSDLMSLTFTPKCSAILEDGKRSALGTGRRRISLARGYDVAVLPGGMAGPPARLQFDPSFDELVPLEEIAPEYATVPKEFFVHPLPPDLRSLVVGRVHLTEGKAEKEPEPAFESILGPVSLEAANGFVKKRLTSVALAVAVEQSIQVPTAHPFVILRFISHVDPEFNFDLVFRPEIPGRDVVVEIVNEPEVGEFCTQEKFAIFDHFAGFYHLGGADASVTENLPVPVLRQKTLACSKFFEERRRTGGGRPPVICMSPKMVRGT